MRIYLYTPTKPFDFNLLQLILKNNYNISKCFFPKMKNKSK